jgi:hypothetical protein
MIECRSGSVIPDGWWDNYAMRQLQLFTTVQIAGMRDRAASRNHSPGREEFRRVQERRRAWGLARRHAEGLRRARSGLHETPCGSGRRQIDPSLTPKPSAPESWTRAASNANVRTGGGYPQHLAARSARPKPAVIGGSAVTGGSGMTGGSAVPGGPAVTARQAVTAGQSVTGRSTVTGGPVAKGRSVGADRPAPARRPGGLVPDPPRADRVRRAKRGPARAPGQPVLRAGPRECRGRRATTTHRERRFRPPRGRPAAARDNTGPSCLLCQPLSGASSNSRQSRPPVDANRGIALRHNLASSPRSRNCVRQAAIFSIPASANAESRPDAFISASPI